jgi:aldehyde:ferredoxin oxidoreductase
MELYEKGAISKSDTKKPLEFGSGDALVYFTEQTAMRSGFGNELAEGGKRLCEKYGHPELFMGTKGMEFPAYDPRAIQGMGLGYATSNRGGCHLKAYTVSAEVFGIPEKMDPASIEGKAALTIAFQNLTSAWDASGLCIFLSFGVGGDDILAELVTATGVEYTLDELLKVGERIYNLERQWLLHAGFSGADDNLPKRLTDTPIPVGPTKGQVSRLSEMLPEYYRLRGWTPDGVPTSGKLAELDLPTN